MDEDLAPAGTIKTSVIQARRGQGKFRANVEAIERSCRLTGITNPTLLIASHIKPCGLCETAQERLDGLNGLLLTPDADLLFDRGLISFADDGDVLVSPRMDRLDLQRLGFEALAWERLGFAEAQAAWRTGGLVDGQRRCLLRSGGGEVESDPNYLHSGILGESLRYLFQGSVDRIQDLAGCQFPYSA